MSQRPAAPRGERPPPRWSGGIPAGRIFGVPLVVSPAWLVVVVIGTIALGPPVRSHDHALSPAMSYVVSFVLVLLVYLAVLIHEASHVLVAKALGMKVGRVILQLLGAVSEVLEEATTPGREYLVAVVGPTTSLLLAGVAAAIGAQFPPDSVGYLLGWGSAWVNGIVAAFNLLPGLPLDGGRLLRAAIWHVTHDKLRGLLIAGWVGRGLAGVVLLTGFYAPGSVTGGHTYGALYLVLVAFFLYSNASVSIAQAKVGSALPRLDLASLIRPALTVDAQLPLAEAVRRARLGNARALVVVDSHDHWSGIVSEAAVQATPVERQPWMSVSELARPVEDGLVLDPGLSGEALMTAIRLKPATEYLVASSDGTLRGVLARSDIAAALRAAGVH